MTPEAFSRHCLSLPAATMNVQWQVDRVFKVGGKMFAVLGPNGHCSFKASEITFEVLTEQGIGRPAPYLARAKWLYFESTRELPKNAKDLLREAHRLVAAKLTKAQKRELGLLP